MNTLHTPDLTLLPQTAAHAPAMFDVLSDPAIYTCENAPPASLDALRERFARLESRRSADARQRWLNWVVQAADERLIGFVQATLHADDSAAIAYEFASSHWGRGLASQAVRAMLDELAGHCAVHRFFAVLKRRNERSSRLLERLGFAPASSAFRAEHPIDDDELLMERSARFSGPDSGFMS